MLVGLLHVRGGVSIECPGTPSSFVSSPRPWRCFYLMNPSDIFFLVFSTSVEVFPGGGSIQTVGLKSSPRPWRCFRACRQCIARAQVFSTSVEVFPINRLDWRAFERLLHVRGGVSERLCNDHDSRQSSPRPWRCFLKSYRLNRNKYVFSTSVEVFLEIVSVKPK